MDKRIAIDHTDIISHASLINFIYIVGINKTKG